MADNSLSDTELALLALGLGLILLNTVYLLVRSVVRCVRYEREHDQALRAERRTALTPTAPLSQSTTPRGNVVLSIDGSILAVPYDIEPPVRRSSAVVRRPFGDSPDSRDSTLRSGSTGIMDMDDVMGVVTGGISNQDQAHMDA